MPASEVIRVRHASRAAAWGNVANVLLTYWNDGMDADPARQYVADSARLARLEPRTSAGFGLVVLSPGAGLPANEARQILARSAERSRLREVGVAVITQGEGFRASAARAVITGVALRSGQGTVRRAFGSMGEAHAFLEARARAVAAALASAEALGAGIEALRKAAQSATT